MTTALVLLPARPGCAQAPAPASDSLPYRSPNAARLFAIVPGLGHIYAGEYRNGLGYYFGTVLLVGSGALIYSAPTCAFTSDEDCHPHTSQRHVAGALIMAAGLAIWVRSIIDAPRAARRTNARHAQLLLQPADGGGLRFGVTIR